MPISSPGPGSPNHGGGLLEGSKLRWVTGTGGVEKVGAGVAVQIRGSAGARTPRARLPVGCTGEPAHSLWGGPGHRGLVGLPRRSRGTTKRENRHLSLPKDRAPALPALGISSSFKFEGQRGREFVLRTRPCP